MGATTDEYNLNVDLTAFGTGSMTYMVDFTVVVTWTHITDPTITISDEITLSMVTLCSVTAGTSAFPDYTVDV